MALAALAPVNIPKVCRFHMAAAPLCQDKAKDHPKRGTGPALRLIVQAREVQTVDVDARAVHGRLER